MTRGLRLTESELEAVQKRLQGLGVGKGLVQLGEARYASPTAKKGHVEDDLWLQIEQTGLPVPALEYRFTQARRWRFDLAWPHSKFAVEVDGMVHRIKGRFKADLEKHQAAFFLGWRVLRVSPLQVRNGDALVLISAVFRDFSGVPKSVW